MIEIFFVCFLFSVPCRPVPGVSVVAGVQSSRRQVGGSSSVGTRTPPGSLDEYSGIPSRMSSTPIRLRDQTHVFKEFSAHFEESLFPGLMGRMDTELTGLDSPLEPLGAAVSKGVRRSSRVSRKP